MSYFLPTPPVKYPPPKPSYATPKKEVPQSDTLLWILEYLKIKYPEDKDALEAMIQVTKTK